MQNPLEGSNNVAHKDSALIINKHNRESTYAFSAFLAGMALLWSTYAIVDSIIGPFVESIVLDPSPGQAWSSMGLYARYTGIAEFVLMGCSLALLAVAIYYAARYIKASGDSVTRRLMGIILVTLASLQIVGMIALLLLAE